ncbi:hypothetical protein [Herbaspirillum sp. alder98]|uniref:hypothetical protein n=1 Tax=Herbaspirillum sp. alder98 TaxID=2913096 RepID=UPI001CD91767|nr:hypothetical protein [Herbaspirillum sp. alder98]MCA1324569.1 hypothetical protein [Herbaspirillum sp. alder98]
MQDSINTAGSSAAAARRSGERAIRTQQSVNDDVTNVDNVNIFLKYAKKAEETAQAAV